VLIIFGAKIVEHKTVGRIFEVADLRAGIQGLFMGPAGIARENAGHGTGYGLSDEEIDTLNAKLRLAQIHIRRIIRRLDDTQAHVLSDLAWAGGGDSSEGLLH
jgi:hypothetical protein